MSNLYRPDRAARLAVLSLGPWLLLATACPSDSTTTTDSGSDTDPTTTTSDTTDPDVTTTTGTPTTTDATTDAPTSTSTGPAPAVCGDGLVGEAEVCDDGNDEPDDGCNSKCEKTADVLWTYMHNGAADEFDSARAVAIDKTGRIILAGIEGVSPADTDALLIALNPDGTELWRKTYPDMLGERNGFEHVVVDDDGNIFAAGYEEGPDDSAMAVVRSFDADGNEGWSFVDGSPVMDYASNRRLLLADGALYSTGQEDLLDMGTQMTVRRHDLATGEAVWKTVTQADTFRVLGYLLVRTDAGLLAGGIAVDEDDMPRPALITLDTDGAIVDTLIEDHPGGGWFDAAPIGDAGDLVLVGRLAPEGVTGVDFGLRRVGPDLAEKWTVTKDYEFLFGLGNGVAVGPDERIFASGFFQAPGQFDNAFAGLYAGDGTEIWTHTYNNDDIDLYDDGEAAAWGPDFLVLAGQSNVLGEDLNVWVRAFATD